MANELGPLEPAPGTITVGRHAALQENTLHNIRVVKARSLAVPACWKRAALQHKAIGTRRIGEENFA